jgi:hypothetical protein
LEVARIGRIGDARGPESYKTTVPRRKTIDRCARFFGPFGYLLSLSMTMQVFRVFGIVPDARSPSRSFENPVDSATADIAAPDSYKTTALPIELGRREFPNDFALC